MYVLFPIAPIYARCILPPRGYMRRQTPGRRAHDGSAIPICTHPIARPPSPLSPLSPLPPLPPLPLPPPPPRR